MEYQKYYEARDIVTEILRKDLIGPVEENEIICKDRPLEYYITGKLYPQYSDANVAGAVSSEDIGEIEDETGISLANGSNPSSCGITFQLAQGVSDIHICARAFRYEQTDYDTAKEELGFAEGEYQSSDPFWKRQPANEYEKTILLGELKTGEAKIENMGDELYLHILLHRVYQDGSRTVTVSLVNNNKLAQQSRTRRDDEVLLSFFQPEISIAANPENSFEDVRKNIHMNSDPELLDLEMLYSEEKSYAVGHGCAANWDLDEFGNCRRIYIDYLPEYEVLQMMPSLEFKGNVVQMQYLSEAGLKEITEGLNDLINGYEDWINSQNQKISKLPSLYQETAHQNMGKCLQTCEQLRKSVKCLKDPTVFYAFRLANKAMFIQRKQILESRGIAVRAESICWYPFQLAFFLQEIVAIAEPESREHDKVDLLWFPTGGGKTEAYLGIAAFTIFLRRLRYRKRGGGVTVLMRYTLRLLSFQQFERAAAMICACELIRQEEHIEGGEIGIGLWAGKALTPNKIEMADAILKGGQDPDSPESNPRQLEKCPWCHCDIQPEDYTCDIPAKRMRVRCSNPKCKFHNGLPVYLVDEEIYKYKPAYIVATVDKFAQIALREETSGIFGINEGLIPPQLIIQDELHLISGPLGTITGAYESAITKLCEYKGHKPKIIASTATIRNAKDQIRGLYGMDYTQFPPQGLSINDSYFAVQSDRDHKPSRKYMGLMASGTSTVTMYIRMTASLLYATRYLTGLGYDDDVVDSFWTITSYFNSLRELGGAIIRVEDDVQDRFSFLRTKKFARKYPLSPKCHKRYDHYKELTSREKSSDIGSVIQNELTVQYSSSDEGVQPYDIILASNMISVGVDIGRLGVMTVLGQPKTTSEYIQATSRVGREHPGLVVTAYNKVRSRDRSHYEQFRQYHGSLYRYVEATSVTPFSDRARDRTLQTLYVILCRYTIPELRGDNDAVNFRKGMPGTDKVKDYILNYVKQVDPDECGNVSAELEEIEDEWQRRAGRTTKLKYRHDKYTKAEESLFDDDFEEGSRFRVLNSMRSVETMIDVSAWE